LRLREFVIGRQWKTPPEISTKVDQDTSTGYRVFTLRTRTSIYQVIEFVNATI